MNQRSNPSKATSETRNPFVVGFISTRCRIPDHNHIISPDAVQISPTLSYHHSNQPVTTRSGTGGKMYRVFGTINYWPATGLMHITQRDGALQSEINSLFATAKHPKQDPVSWPAHPCEPDRRQIALYRPVDEHYLAEAEASMFEELETAEQMTALSSWAEDLTNV